MKGGRFLTQVSQRPCTFSHLALSSLAVYFLFYITPEEPVSHGAGWQKYDFLFPNIFFVTPLRVSLSSLTSPSLSCWPLYIPVCLFILLICHLDIFLNTSITAGVNRITGLVARAYFKKNPPGQLNAPSTGPDKQKKSKKKSNPNSLWICVLQLLL